MAKTVYNQLTETFRFYFNPGGKRIFFRIEFSFRSFLPLGFIMRKIILVLFAAITSAFAIDVSGNVSTGFYMGTPFWNSDNYAAGNVIDTEDSFMRTVNQLRLNGKFGKHFNVRFNALRSDGFQSENRLSETKIYQLYGRYKFTGGSAKLGRFVPFNRWIWGSVDGGAASYAFGKRLKISVLGGKHTPYGLLYDSDNSITVVYSDMALRLGAYEAKVKVYKDDNVTKAGVDFFGRTGGLRYNGNYGFDLTNGRLADGGVGLFYLVNRNLNFSGNYRLFRTMPWNLGGTDFQTYLIERFLAGASYKIFTKYSLNLRQMITMTSERKNYLSYITVSHPYFTLGVSYLSGDADMKRLGLVAGLKYTIEKLSVSGGLAPVNYQPRYSNESLTNTAFYFKARYRFLKCLMINANFNYYQFDKAQQPLLLQSKFRGGLQVTYFLGAE